MLTMPVCPLDDCLFARKIAPLDGAVGWLSYPMCGRQHDDPPCPARKRQILSLKRAYGVIEEMPVISYGGTAILSAPPARRLRFLGQPAIKITDLWILANWAKHFSQRNVSWAVTITGKHFSLFRLL
jgi:hypothetical protein